MIHTFIRPTYEAICREVAARMAALIREKPHAVLGLATGSTPLGVYDELARLHREESLDFSQVTIFNLDEYFPMSPDDVQSYHRFMHEQLLSRINCTRFYIPSGVPREEEQIRRDCMAYEEAIREAGGLDLQLLGIGRSGHIGFNEPGSPPESPTRLVTLQHATRADAAAAFGGRENVPVRAITMGVATILEAREIILMAAGRRKAAIIQRALEGPITSKVPASFLRNHPNVTCYLDQAAAEKLSEYSKSGRGADLGANDFSARRRALLSLAQAQGKTLAQLCAKDVEAAGNDSLADEALRLTKLCAEVEADLRSRLDDDRHLPCDKNILCLSPHPDDDVICCGATLTKLAQRGNRVTVVYGVSGSRAVRDKDVLALLASRQPAMTQFIEERIAQKKAPGRSFSEVVAHVQHTIFTRSHDEESLAFLHELKGLLRQSETTAACRKMGATPLFLNLPFYRNEMGHKSSVGEEDIRRMHEALQSTRPDLVLLTGEMNDPHGTHEMCAQAFERAAFEYSKRGASFQTWHYRGAWDEYQSWEGSYFSVFGVEEMEHKTSLILEHVSQLDPLFPGESDPREFYERARDRNRATARILQQLGVLPPSRSFAPLFAEVFQFGAVSN